MQKHLLDFVREIDSEKDWVIYHKDEHIDYELTIIKGFKKPRRLTFSFPIILHRLIGKALKMLFKDLTYYSPVSIRNITYSEGDVLESGYWKGGNVVIELGETAYYLFVRLYFDEAEENPKELRSRFLKSVIKASEGLIIEQLPYSDIDLDEEDEDVIRESYSPAAPSIGVPSSAISLDEFLSFYPEETRLALQRIKGMVDVITSERGKGIHFSAVLAGTPGTGKSLFCSLISQYAAERKALVILSSGGSITDYIVDIIQMFPCVLFVVDEGEPLLLSREREPKVNAPLIMQLLDGYYTSSITASWGLIITTNRPHVIDPAILRPVRLDELVEFSPLEDETISEKVFLFWCEKWEVQLPDGWDKKLLKGRTHAECAAVAQKIARMQKFGIPVTAETVKMLFKSVTSWAKPHKLKSVADEREKVGF